MHALKPPIREVRSLSLFIHFSGVDFSSTPVPFKEANLRVAREVLPWPEDRDERVSVNSFGIGGSNAHVRIKYFLDFY